MAVPETDDQLLKKAASTGDRSAIDELIRRYANLVDGVALRQTGDRQLACDVSQAVFLVFLRRLGSIRNGRALPNWFLQVTRKVARDARRTKDRRTHHEHKAAKPEQAMPSTHAEDDEKLAIIDDAIASLGSSDRELVLMRYLQNRDMAAIAGSLGIREETVRKRITRAVDRIRRFVTKDGSATSVAVVGALLVTAGSHSAPAAVVNSLSAVTGGGASGAAVVTLTNGVLKKMFLTKVSLLAAGALGVALTTVGGAVIVRQALADTPPAAVAPAALPPATTAPASMTPEQALTELDKTYALKPGEILRLVDSPFSPARDAWLAKEFPRSQSDLADHIRSIGFCWNGSHLGGPAGNSEPIWTYMSSGDQDLASLVGQGLKVEWFQVDGLKDIKWKPVHADLVVRTNATVRQKLDALTGIIKQRTGQAFDVAEVVKTRPTLVLYGGTTGSGFAANLNHPGGDPTEDAIIFTQAPWTDELKEQWTQWVDNWAGTPDPGYSGPSFRGAHLGGSLQESAQLLGSPYFHVLDPTYMPHRPDRDLLGQGEMNDTRLFVVAPDAHLDPSDPQYESKMGRVLDNVKKQVGGDWRIEPREITVYTFRPTGL